MATIEYLGTWGDYDFYANLDINPGCDTIVANRNFDPRLVESEAGHAKLFALAAKWAADNNQSAVTISSTFNEMKGRYTYWAMHGKEAPMNVSACAKPRVWCVSGICRT